ncbi:MAG: peptidylprolyl isomerase [Rhodobacter sp.]|nr:peptidylprolyl isomerase [Rhodobacter sp.]
MPRNTRLALALAVLAVAAYGVYFFMIRPAPAPAPVPVDVSVPAAGTGGPIEGDAPGPYLTITVAGEANGQITIDLFEQLAPNHVEQISELASAGAYDGVVFHRVIAGFMAQTGDVQFGRSDGDTARAGMGGSERPDLKAEFSDIPFDRGIVGMARSQSPDSANSQFFIMFDEGHYLNGEYTVVGKVTEGLDVLDAIKLGQGPNGSVIGDPDQMKQVTIAE